MDKPTPGPWVAICDGGWWMVLTETHHSIDEEDDRQIPVIDLHHGGYDYSDYGLGSVPANARLIAAAPDLLEALREILGPLSVCSDNRNVRDDQVLPVDMTMGELRKARAAIARATGEA